MNNLERDARSAEFVSKAQQVRKLDTFILKYNKYTYQTEGARNKSISLIFKNTCIRFIAKSLLFHQDGHYK